MIEEQFIALGPQRLVAAVMFGVDRFGVAEAERDGFGGRVGEMKDIFVERGHRLLGGPDRHGHPRRQRHRFHREAPRKRSVEHTSELQSLMRTSYAVFFFKK